MPLIAVKAARQDRRVCNHRYPASNNIKIFIMVACISLPYPAAEPGTKRWPFYPIGI
jgi:hypothetical protein